MTWLIGCHTEMWCVWPLPCICRKIEQYWVFSLFLSFFFARKTWVFLCFCSFNDATKSASLFCFVSNQSTAHWCQAYVFNLAHLLWISGAFFLLGPAFVLYRGFFFLFFFFLVNLSETIHATFLKPHAWWILMWASWVFFRNFKCLGV